MFVFGIPAHATRFILAKLFAFNDRYWRQLESYVSQHQAVANPRNRRLFLTTVELVSCHGYCIIAEINFAAHPAAIDYCGYCCCRELAAGLSGIGAYLFLHCPFEESVASPSTLFHYSHYGDLAMQCTCLDSTLVFSDALVAFLRLEFIY